jgi:flagellar biosynthesis chaperone FliJ
MQASNRTTLTDESIAELDADLQQQIDELESELEHEREQRRELEETVDKLDSIAQERKILQTTLDILKQQHPNVEHKIEAIHQKVARAYQEGADDV